MTKIIFACVENACRSQMAEGFAREMAKENIEISSGGSEPADQINEKAVEVMAERGIDISSQIPAEINPEDSKSADLIVIMGCGTNACPAPLGGEMREWNIDDPSGKDVEKFREARDEIEKKVRELLEEL